MDIKQDAKFTAFLRGKAEEAEKAIRYRPSYFLNMLATDGGYRVASKLLTASKVSDGFTKLLLGGRVDLSVEALVVESPWRVHFDQALLDKAEQTLTIAGYVFQRHQTASTDSHPSAPAKASAGKQKNSISFSGHCERLGAPLKNTRNCWCGLSVPKRRAVFSVWSDGLSNGRYVLWHDEKSPTYSRVGARDLHGTALAVLANGYDAYGVLCDAVDPAERPRVRGFFQEETVLILHLVKEQPGIVAYVQGEIAASAVIDGSGFVPAPFPSAVDDLGTVPPGVDRPDRVTSTCTGYRRNDAVRQHVLRRANGRCEHCGSEGFELPDGRRYVETHHIISMANHGPDRVDNVIGLCASHHREAHYGRDAERLESTFMIKLQHLNG